MAGAGTGPEPEWAGPDDRRRTRNQGMQDMGRDQKSERIVWLVLLAWAVAFFGAFAAFWLTPSRDFGLAAGWNKVGVFMTWQGVAALLAVLAAIVSRTLPRGTALRRAGWMPLGVLGLSLAALTLLIYWANMQRTDPDLPPPGPPTQTAPAVNPPGN